MGSSRATRGNHGQSLASAGARAGVPVTIVVPHGNSTEKNAAMRALGAELIEHGRDFDEAKEHAVAMAAERGLHLRPSFHRDLVRRGRDLRATSSSPRRASSTPSMFRSGSVSGICGLIGTRDLLGLRPESSAWSPDSANAYRAVRRGRPSPCRPTSALTFADGMAVRVPDATALEVIRRGAERIVEVSDDEIAEAMRITLSAPRTQLRRGRRSDAPLAALMKERDRLQGQRASR